MGNRCELREGVLGRRPRGNLGFSDSEISLSRPTTHELMPQFLANRETADSPQLRLRNSLTLVLVMSHGNFRILDHRSKGEPYDWCCKRLINGFSQVERRGSTSVR